MRISGVLGEMGSALHFECYDGYQLVGNNTVTCLPLDGQWSSTWPKCVRRTTLGTTPALTTPSLITSVRPSSTTPAVKCAELRVSDARVDYLDGGMAAGQRALVQCNRGFTLVPHRQSPIVFCTNEGRWTMPLECYRDLGEQ